ncbi:MAG TPA: MOSC N-terminal beta barrel domain-containing protein [Nocardioidaceae bacterium]|nr:MOSC N-terminal beta barrel domain-containing protein [Nocardioidaceae bacterium]
MRIARIGLTPLKGARHVRQESVTLTPDGPVGDRLFCLVDPARGRVVRTVQNPALMQTVARWEGGVLRVELPGRTVEGTPMPTGEVLKVDYWGRTAAVEVCAGPWAGAFAAHLGYDVVLARAVHSGEVVYGAPVSLVTTSSLRVLSERLGRDVAGARFRATFVVDTGDTAPSGVAGRLVEDAWVGRELRLGEATVRVRGPIARCAVMDLEPRTGVRDAAVLGAVAGYRQQQGEIDFGVDAVVTAPGRARTGDRVELGRG